MTHDTHSLKRHNSSKVAVVIENILLVIWGIFFFLFPLIISSQTTNAFFLPKQILLLVVVLISFLLWGFKIITEKTILLRRTPFDIPILLFTIIIFISSILAINRYDALISFVSFLSIILAYFIVVNLARKENAILYLLSALVLGSSIISLLTIFSYFKIYLVPLSYAHNPAFTLLGSYLEQAFYIGFILPIAGYFTYPILKGKSDAKNILFASAFLLNTAGLLFTLIILATSQKPLILPFETGFQIAFAAISQDVGRIFQGFFFGSGFGTFVPDFTRFKLASFNGNQNFWYLTFSQSSSFVLELLTTTGILGLLSFFFIIYRIFKKSNALWVNPITMSLFIAVIVSFALPMSLLSLGLFFFLLATFSSIEAFNHPNRYWDLELQTFALKKNLPNHQGSEEAVAVNSVSKFISICIFIIILALIGSIGWFGGRFIVSDWYFQKSLIAASKNDGKTTYEDQFKAIQIFPYRDIYYRIFSQTNLILANSLVALQPKGQKINEDTQKKIYALIQQAINYGRAATYASPQNVGNWQNLESIYRALIGFGQNAESFTIQANQQAIALDKTNPQEYIVLGGIYYQLGQWDNAIAAFQVAIQLKPDFANGYYNLGHALEQKGDLNNTMAQYQIVKQLVSNDPTNKKKISDEIEALQKKITENGGQPPAEKPQETPASIQQQNLNLNKPENIFPTQKPQVKIPAPTNLISPVPSPTAPTSPKP